MVAVHAVQLEAFEQRFRELRLSQVGARIESIELRIRQNDREMAALHEAVRREAITWVETLRAPMLPAPDVEADLGDGDVGSWEGTMTILDRMAGQIAEELTLIESGMPRFVAMMIDDQYKGLHALDALSARAASLRSAATWIIRMSERIEDHIDALVAQRAMESDDASAISLEDLRRELGH